MSPNDSVQIDARREEFRKYLNKEGILESISKGNILGGIDNKAVRRWRILNLFTYVLFSVVYKETKLLEIAIFELDRTI